jgi:hypothetical protein
LRHAAEGELRFAFRQGEHLLEIAAIAAAGPRRRHKHVDEATALGYLSAQHQDRVIITDDGDAPHSCAPLGSAS